MSLFPPLDMRAVSCNYCKPTAPKVRTYDKPTASFRARFTTEPEQTPRAAAKEEEEEDLAFAAEDAASEGVHALDLHACAMDPTETIGIDPEDMFTHAERWLPRALAPAPKYVPPSPPPATILRRRAVPLTPEGLRNLGTEDLVADATPRGIHRWDSGGNDNGDDVHEEQRPEEAVENERVNEERKANVAKEGEWRRDDHSTSVGSVTASDENAGTAEATGALASQVGRPSRALRELDVNVTTKASGTGVKSNNDGERSKGRVAFGSGSGGAKVNEGTPRASVQGWGVTTPVAQGAPRPGSEPGRPRPERELEEIARGDALIREARGRRAFGDVALSFVR